ncbi:unnamed protein product [Discula destructiva]
MAKLGQPLAAFRARHPALADGLAHAWRRLRPYLPPVNFISMHHAYFVFVGLLVAVIFWGISNPSRSVSFIDSLFLVESAFTSSGLNTLNLSELATGQQVILAIMMVLGSPVVVGLFTIRLRAHFFEKRFQDIVQKERSRSMQTTGTIVGMAGAMVGIPVMSSFKRVKKGTPIGPFRVRRQATWRHNERAEADAFRLGSPPKPGQEARSPPVPLQPIVQGLETPQFDEPNATTSPRWAFSPSSNNTQRRPFSSDQPRSAASDAGFDFKAFISTKKSSIGRNGQFFDLTDDQREYLGGVEYRALNVLFVIVGVYFVVIQVLGAIALGAWISVHGSAIAAVNDQNPWWTGIFLCLSSFNNAGMTLLDAGIPAFDNDAFVLTVVALLALAGNYAFPAFIRVTIKLCSVVLKLATAENEYAHLKDALDFILKYPRRLFMLMFPSRANWVFVGFCTSLAVLNWVLLPILCIGNSVLEVFPPGQRTGLALFQALAIPSNGFTVISASSLYFDVQVLWVLMMYLAAYPEIITMRNSNVYEERSLGIYKASSDDDKSGEDSSDQDTLPVPISGGSTLPSGRPMSASGISFATSTQSIRKLAAVGRRGTAFVGRQIQKRVNNFQGVGVAPRPQLRRATEIQFDGPSKPAVVVAEEGSLDLVTQHLRSQLSHDIWSIAVALFVITLIETSHSIQDPGAYSVFNFLFEVVSGYTNIGLSIGLPGQAFSFSGGWYTGSKLVMVLMMVRGRHRGLPVALDHAVKLPGWDNVKREQEDADIRRNISRSRVSLERAVSH